MRRNQSYWKLSNSPFYSFVFTLPLFGFYEVLTLFLSRNQMMTLRNGADVLFRQLLEMLGVWGMYILSIGFIVAFMVTFLLQKRKWWGTTVKGEYLIYMLLEGTGWGILLFLSLKYFPKLLMFPTGEQLSQQIVLAIGAGLYEEFLFRVVAISLFSLCLKVLLGWAKWQRMTIAILFSAGLFSAFHFLGEFGEAYNMTAFIYRGFAGVLLGILYVTRGFGITSYSHMVYDFIIVIRMTVVE